MRITIRRRTLALIVLIIIAAVVAWGITRKTAPPEVQFVRVARQTIVSTTNTNGKVEPIEWASARAERQGIIQKLLVQRGQTVAKEAPLVTLDSSAAAAELSTAEAQIAQARAQQQTLSQGGQAAERTQIENELTKARLALEVAQRDLASAQRLYAKQAGTKFDVDAARARVDDLQNQIQGLENRRRALVEPQQKSAAAAKLQEAEAAASLAKHNLTLSVVRAPIPGTVYQFDQRIGNFVNPGDVIANIGKLDRVRVIVYVDEPELGRVAIGQPVTITWDAMPGRQWKGTVEKLPTQIVALGTRQVGEVNCVIENPDHDLLPGTNITADIVSKVAPNALAVPKQVLRREGAQTGVFLLTSDNRVVWRPVELGVTSLTTVQVTKGLSEGDSVALPTDKPIKDGSKVEPVYP